MTPAKGFAEMKDSGIEWIGGMPAHWQVKVLFQLVSQVKNKNRDLLETNLLSLSYGKIKRKSIDDTDGLLPASFDGCNIIEKDDIVLRLTDLQNDHTSLRVGRATERGIITSAYITIHPTNSQMSEYLYYLLHSFDIKKGFYGMGAGVRQGLNYDEVKMLKFPLPPLDEQTAIASYLDTQCAKIDEIIAQAKASIEDYKQWKASIIYEAVTKGLDPNVEMKDSGIEWIKQIPQHWGKSKIKKVAQAFNGDRSSNYPSGDDIVSSGILFITSNNLGSIELNIGIPSNKYITPQKYNELRGAKVQINDIVFCLRGSVGKCSINKQIMEGTIASSLVVIRAESINPDYLNYVLQNSAVSEMALTTAIGIGSLNLSAENIMSFVIPLPSPAEQSIIVRYLNHKCKTVEGLITEKQSLIDDLESYKKSLIYEVVTGKRRIEDVNQMTIAVLSPEILQYRKALLMLRVLDLLGAGVRGRIQLQKCMFAAECLLNMPFRTQFIRYEHGPYDPELLNIEEIVNKKGWYTVLKGSPVTYQKGNEFEKGLQEYMATFSDIDVKLEKIVGFLKPMKTSQAERVATLLAAWNDFIIDGVPNPTDKEIIDEVVTHWTPNKANPQYSTWQDTLCKMREHRFVPKGSGVHTLQKEA